MLRNNLGVSNNGYLSSVKLQPIDQGDEILISRNNDIMVYLRVMHCTIHYIYGQLNIHAVSFAHRDMEGFKSQTIQRLSKDIVDIGPICIKLHHRNHTQIFTELKKRFG